MKAKVLRVAAPLLLLASLASPFPVSAVVVGIAVLLTAALSIDRGLSWDRTALLGLGLFCSGAACVGLILNLTPGGLTRTSWSISAAIASAVILFSRRHASVDWRLPRFRVIPIASILTALALVVAGLVIANRGASRADSRPLALWLTRSSPEGVTTAAYSPSSIAVKVTVACDDRAPRNLGVVDLQGGRQTILPTATACANQTVVSLVDPQSHETLRYVSTYATSSTTGTGS
jgi:hypothetical protein